MSTPEQPATSSSPALHDLLLGVAGRLPDDLIAVARNWLADGRFGDVARAVSFAALGYRVPLRESDLIALADVLVENGVEPFGLGQLEVARYDVAPPYLFSSGPPAVDDDGSAGREEAAVAAAQPSGVGLWKVWRRTADGSPWPAPRPVWLLEVTPDADPADAGHRLQAVLEEAGESYPQVEAYPTGAELPLYQTLARAEARLVWAREPDRQIRLASVFDEVDPAGTPSFSPDHPRITDAAERARLVAYLEQGQALLVSPTLIENILEPDQGPVVPMSFRTDGSWIWCDALTYYLERHGLAPEPDFLAHLEATGARPAVDGVGLHRALSFLNK